MRCAMSATSTLYFSCASRMAKVFRKPIWALPPPMASTEAASLVPTSILKVSPVILPRQSAISWPPLVILPTSTDGTKVMTIGLSDAPSSPAAGVMAFGIGSHFAAGISVGAGVGGTSVGATVGGTSVGGTAVGAGGSVAAGVAAGLQAASTSDTVITSANSTNVRRLFILSPHRTTWIL